MNIFTQYVYHIDELRRTSKIRTTDFCDEVCSDRQYRRYLSGEQIISQKNLHLFCVKLGLSPNDFYTSFYRKDNEETIKVTIIYKQILANENALAEENIINLRKHKFLNIQSKRFYEYCIIRNNEITKKINSMLALDQYKVLGNYPDCLEKNTIDFVDVIIIDRIAHIEHIYNDDKALKFLYKLLFDRSIMYVSSHSSYLLPAIYNGVTKILVLKELYVEAEKIATTGINYCIEITDFHALSNLYYAKSFILFKLGKVNDAFSEAKKCLATAIAKNSEHEIELFTRLLKKDLRINPMDLFIPGFIKSDK